MPVWAGGMTAAAGVRLEAEAAERPRQEEAGEVLDLVVDTAAEVLAQEVARAEAEVQAADTLLVVGRRQEAADAIVVGEVTVKALAEDTLGRRVVLPRALEAAAKALGVGVLARRALVSVVKAALAGEEAGAAGLRPPEAKRERLRGMRRTGVVSEGSRLWEMRLTRRLRKASRSRILKGFAAEWRERGLRRIS